ncbi:MAG TPA: GDSL-type esterase/lipase family protein, partial [Lachnospiraceae bacterium]|nr:GDSL-type esterase/lipase family protein [Lachnospiraceae bacterium]
MIIKADAPVLTYCGRIDFTKKEEPVFIYPYSSVSMVFTGKRISIIVRNHHVCWENHLGYVIDGVQGRIRLPENAQEVTLLLADDLTEEEHELFLFKRQDACHYFDLLGFVLEDGAEVRSSAPLPARKIEVYGDSVSAGEVSEAIDYVGKPDPVHNGEYSNAYYSYAAYTARMLHAQLHDIAQGGIALLDHTGYFAPAFGYIGMENRFDKLKYNPELGEVNTWDFSRYTPHVVVVAIGQNDNYPEDYMQDDYRCEKAVEWRTVYERLLRDIREKYQKALIIAATTILEHDESWDRSIED